ncbi:nucleoside-triphosphatase [Chloroflexota bacterium]
MLIIITGKIGSGKTTVCQKVADQLQSSGRTVGGVLTIKNSPSEISVQNIVTGQTHPLANETKDYNGPGTPRYSFSAIGIAFGNETISNAAHDAANVVIIDELGQLELKGEGFAPTLCLITGGNIECCIAVIRDELLPTYLPLLPSNPRVFVVNNQNRNTLAAEICALLLG